MRIQSVLRRSLLAAAALVATTGSAAFAQETQTNGNGDARTVDAREAEATQAADRPGTVVDVPRRERAPRWDLSGGYESDSQDTTYAFLGPSYNRPLSDSVALRLALRANHVHYEFDNGEGGRTEVGGPGLSPSVGLRFGDRNWFQVSGGVSIRDEERVVHGPSSILSTTSDTEVGLSLGADAWYNTSRRSNIHAMVHYGALSNYTWARLAGRHQVTNFDWQGPVTFYLGAELVGQGNEDIRSFQVGPVIEMTLGRTPFSLSGRVGYKRSTYDIGEAQGGPYFGVGLWKRF